MLVNRKKLEIFAESHALGQIEAMLREAGFRGWSVFAGMEGAGAHGAWMQTGVEDRGLHMIVAIGAEAASEKALTWLEAFFSTYPGIVAVSEVSVMRGDRF